MGVSHFLSVSFRFLSCLRESGDIRSRKWAFQVIMDFIKDGKWKPYFIYYREYMKFANNFYNFLPTWILFTIDALHKILLGIILIFMKIG